jgi:dihydropteroate synthase
MFQKYTLPSNNQTHIMGILNITPDSFSGDGLQNATNKIDHCIRKAESMIADGADLLDIGAESTRPTATPLDAQEELDRLMPVIEALASRIDIPLSVDTKKAIVAEHALKIADVIINDVGGLAFDPDMLPLVVKHQCFTVIMHHDTTNYKAVDAPYGGHYIKNSANTAADGTQSITQRVKNDLATQAQHAIDAGLDPAKIILDIGIGFGKTPQENIELLAHLDAFTNLPYPILVGASRKSFIGHATKAPVDKRLGGSLAALVASIQAGARIIRVHDVFESVQAARIIDQMNLCRS